MTNSKKILSKKDIGKTLVIDKLESLIIKGDDGRAIAVKRSGKNTIDVLCCEGEILIRRGKKGRRINYSSGRSRIFLYKDTDFRYSFGSYSSIDEQLKEKGC